MLKDDLLRMRKEIRALASRYGARRVRIFGSVARGEETSESDVDILVEFPRGYDMFRQRLALAREMERLIGRRVDLIPEHELNPLIREEVFKESIPL